MSTIYELVWFYKKITIKNLQKLDGLVDGIGAITYMVLKMEFLVHIKFITHSCTIGKVS